MLMRVSLSSPGDSLIQLAILPIISIQGTDRATNGSRRIATCTGRTTACNRCSDAAGHGSAADPTKHPASKHAATRNRWNSTGELRSYFLPYTLSLLFTVRSELENLRLSLIYLLQVVKVS